MKKDYNNLISILNSYINNISLDIVEDVDPPALIRLAEIHNVTGILAAINRKYKLQCLNDYSSQLDAYMFSAIKMSVIWDKLYSEISSELAEHKIRNIVVKGPVVKRYYPDPDLRTMGDIDLIVHKSDMPSAVKVMKNLGFTCEEGCIDEYKFMHNNLCIELHEDLTSKDFGTGVDYKTEMQDLFNNVKNPGEYIQELTDEYHLIYLLLHIAQHLISEGCGIRQIMDIAVTVKNIELDFNYIWQELDKLKLTDFAHCIFYLCYRWFDVKCDDYVMDNDVYESLSNHILEGGVFGHAVNRQNNLIMRESIYGNKLKTLIKRIFPGVAETRSKVVWFKNKPKLLLPLAWVCRWYDMCKENPIRVKNYMQFLLKKDNTQISEEYRVLQAMGFYKN